MGGAPSFLFFLTTFATLEHGLQCSSVVEAQKLPSALDGGTLELNVPCSSMAEHAQAQGAALKHGLWLATPSTLLDRTLKLEALHSSMPSPELQKIQDS